MSSIFVVHHERFDMRYAILGEGGMPFVMLPGVGIPYVTDSAAAVEKAYEKLLDRYRIYLFDRIEDIPAHYTIEAMAEDTAEAMRMLGIGRAVVYGASQGGQVAMALALNHPETVEKLILASTAAKCRQSSLEEVFGRWKALVEQREDGALTEDFIDRVYSAPVAAALKGGPAPVYTERERKRFSGMLEAFRTVDLSERLGDIRVPALLLAAEGDRVFGMPDYELLKERLSCSSFCYGPEYGHGVYDEAPDFTERIRSFLLR